VARWAEYAASPVANTALRDRVIADNEHDLLSSFALKD
jgi:hypothetical protein